MPCEYAVETKERVARLFLERRDQTPTESFLASFRRVRELTGIPIDTMRGWVTKAQVDAGDRPSSSTAERDELRRLKCGNHGVPFNLRTAVSAAQSLILGCS